MSDFDIVKQNAYNWNTVMRFCNWPAHVCHVIPDILCSEFAKFTNPVNYIESVLQLVPEEQFVDRGYMSNDELEEIKNQDVEESGLCNWTPTSSDETSTTSLIIPIAVMDRFISFCLGFIDTDAEQEIERMALLFGTQVQQVPDDNVQRELWKVTHMYFPVTTATSASVECGNNIDDNVNMSAWAAENNVSMLGWIHVCSFLYKYFY